MQEFRTAALVAATNAWWAGRLAPDELATAVGPGAVLTAPTAQPLLVGLAALREAGAKALVLELPRPGDPGNLVASPGTLSRAIAAGAVAVTTGALACALVPNDVGWSVEPAQVMSWPSPAGARRDLLEAVESASGEISRLDLGRNLPEAAATVEQRLSAELTCLPYLDARAADLAIRAARVLLMLEIARSVAGAALTVGAAHAEASILGPTSSLEAAARAALAAAVNDAARDLVGGR